jgi:hypothetical protein
MPVNLINEKDLNAYLTDIVYRGQQVETFTAGNFQSDGFVLSHKDAIIRTMLAQWMKTRMRAYLVGEENVAYLRPVSYSNTLPTWAKNCLNDGKKVYSFCAENFPKQLQNQIIQVYDFLYGVAENYIKKSLKQSENKGTAIKLRIDCLKTNNEYDSFEKALLAAQKWHDIMAYKASQKKKDDLLKKKAEKGTILYEQMADNMFLFQLKTPEALDFESEYMGHCIGKGSYDDDVINGKIKIFSLRDENGLPHATLEVRGKTIHQCKGKGNMPPAPKYLPYLQQFLKAKKLKVEEDFKNLGLLKQGGSYYNIWDLPAGFVIKGNFDISDMGLYQLPDMSQVSVEGNFTCNTNHLKSLVGSPKHVGGSFYCYSNELENLEGAPDEVLGNFIFDDNPIVSLTGAPAFIGGNFCCNDMGLTSLKGSPKKVEGDFLCQNNQLTSLADGPVEVGNDFNCSCNLLKDLSGSPEKIGRHFFCSMNHLTSLMGAPLYVGDTMFCGSNPLTNASPAPEYIRFNYKYIVDLPAHINLETMFQNGRKINLASLPSKERDS